MDQETATPTQSNLQRGRACVHCRRRKMVSFNLNSSSSPFCSQPFSQRCDGVRPICGQCDRANRPDDCEYTDGQGSSRTQILEENISRLETRIHELENPAEATTSVILHQPYIQSGRRDGDSLSQSLASSSTLASGIYSFRLIRVFRLTYR